MRSCAAYSPTASTERIAHFQHFQLGMHFLTGLHGHGTLVTIGMGGVRDPTFTSRACVYVYVTLLA